MVCVKKNICPPSQQKKKSKPFDLDFGREGLLCLRAKPFRGSAYRLRYIAKRADSRKYKEQAEQITDKVIASGKQPFRLSFTTAPLRVLPPPQKNKRNRPLRDLFLLFWQGRKVSEKKTVNNCF